MEMYGLSFFFYLLLVKIRLKIERSEMDGFNGLVYWVVRILYIIVCENSGYG